MYTTTPTTCWDCHHTTDHYDTCDTAQQMAIDNECCDACGTTPGGGYERSGHTYGCVLAEPCDNCGAQANEPCTSTCATAYA